ncbi:MAG: hypothetical protein ACJ74Q_01385 [Pyrinomonadaceae bacterium]
MSQLWTVIFFAVLVIAFGLAHWHDREEAKRRERRDMAGEQKTVERIEH